jgi:hypothetical protein
MPSIINATTSTGLVSSADNSGSLQLATNNGTTAVTIDTSQNVGVGNTSPASFASTTNLALGTGSSSAALTVYTGTAQTGAVYFADGTTSADRYRGAIEYSHSSNVLAFTTDASERMRIDTSGNLLVGTTSTLLASGSCFVNDTAAGDSPQLIVRNAQNTAGRYWKLGATGGAGGANPYMIVYTASNAGVYMGYGDTNWSSTSDESKKENLVPIADAITKVSSLRTVIGNFIDDEEKTKHPFLIAQDVQKVLPEAVNEKDGVLGLKYSDMIPLLVASIKELNAKVEAQALEKQALKATPLPAENT